jgi:glutamine synthetase type III
MFNPKEVKEMNELLDKMTILTDKLDGRCEDCEMCEEEELDNEAEELILVSKDDLMEIMYQTEVAFKALQKMLD